MEQKTVTCLTQREVTANQTRADVGMVLLSKMKNPKGKTEKTIPLSHPCLTSLVSSLSLHSRLQFTNSAVIIFISKLI